MKSININADNWNNAVEVLSEYFEQKLPLLDNIYCWPIPRNIDFQNDDEKSNAQNTISLKKHFNRQWLNSSIEEKKNLAREVVRDWGGIRTNNEGRLDGYVDGYVNSKIYMGIDGIASYSKIYSIADIENYAIYDARVAAALNAVQFNAGVSNGIAFNYVPSRNKIIGSTNDNTGFIQREKFKVQSLVYQGWDRITRDETYSHYLELLKECLGSFSDNNLYELEMILFAKAEDECLKAMDTIQ